VWRASTARVFGTIVRMITFGAARPVSAYHTQVRFALLMDGMVLVHPAPVPMDSECAAGKALASLMVGFGILRISGVAPASRPPTNGMHVNS
jgi:hypothetical protein